MKHTARGYWLEEAGAVEPTPPLGGSQRADVVVVGGGYTGLWAAWQLKRLAPGAQVALLEAETCGHGPSGRNGGFCNVMWFSLANMRRRWGDAGALAVGRAAQEAIDGIEAFCAEQGVDAWFRRGGYLQVSTAPAQDGTWADALAACRALGLAGQKGLAQYGGGQDGESQDSGEMMRALSAQEVAARCFSPVFRGGAFYPQSATLQPARLALGLRGALIAAGVHIYERSPVRRLRAGDGQVEVETDGGSLRAGSAVLAIGGAAKARHAPLRNALTVTSSHIVLTEPVPDVLEEIGWTGGECITDCRTMLAYFRTTPDGRIAFGLGGGQIALGARLRGRAEIDPELTAMAARYLRAYFPALEGRRITDAWGGPVDVSPTHLPLVVPLRGPAFAAAGYTGNGVAPSYMVGRALASLALDRRDTPAALPFVDSSPQRVPPEPLHWLGGSAIRAAIFSKEEAEMRGRDPGPLSSALARLPERIGFHLGR